MEQQIRLSVSGLLQRLIDMGVLKKSQINSTVVSYAVDALKASMRENRLAFKDALEK